MIEPYVYRLYVIAANDAETVYIDAAYVRLLSATATPRISFDDGAENPLEVGIGIPVPQGFKAVRLINPTASPLTVEVVFGIGNLADNRLNLTGAVSVRGGAETFTDSEAEVDTSATQLLAANANRTAAVIRAGTADLWLGTDNTVTAGNVPTLAAGEKMTITHTDAVWGIRASGAAYAGAYEETA